MAKDPDYIDPAVLKKRAAESGGAGTKPSRPRVHRVGVDHALGLRVSGPRMSMTNVRAGISAIDTSQAHINIS